MQGGHQGSQVGVVVGVVEFEVGDHPQLGGELHQRAIGFIGLRHQQPAITMATVAAEGRHDAADHGGGVVAGGLQQGGHQGAGGGLAVAAGHGDRGLAGDQRGQHIGAVTKGIPQPAGFLHLRVALRHGRAEHHQRERGGLGSGISGGRLGSDRVEGGGGLLVEDAHTGLAQGRGHGIVAGVGAADAEAAAREDPRQGRHADPAHADEMERLLAVEL